MAWCLSACDHWLASAICPTAAEAWLSSSFSAPFGRPATVRPSAIAPDETTSRLAPRPCSAAMSAISASSQACLTKPREASTRSEEPTLTTTRLNRSREGTGVKGTRAFREIAPLRHETRREAHVFRLERRRRDGKADRVAGSIRSALFFDAANDPNPAVYRPKVLRHNQFR